ITTVFVDLSGAIQLHRNKAIIDHASFIKPEGQKKTIELLFDDPADGGRVRRMMERLAAMAEPEGQVVSDFVTVDGRRHLAGIAYLPGIGWYEITLLDLAVVMPVARFAPVGAVFAITLLLALLLMHLALRRYVLGPVGGLERAMIAMRAGGAGRPRPRDGARGRGPHRGTGGPGSAAPRGPAPAGAARAPHGARHPRGHGRAAGGAGRPGEPGGGGVRGRLVRPG